MNNFKIHTPTYTTIDVDGHMRDAWEFKCEDENLGNDGVITLIDSSLKQFSLPLKLDGIEVNAIMEDTDEMQWMVELIYINPEIEIEYRIFEPIN